ncbi:MAG: PQQ-binding-like beta-propeller repeat protein [Polyangiaceae bacterium]
MNEGAYRASSVRVAPVVYLKGQRAIALDRERGEELWVYDAGAQVTRILIAHSSVYLADAEGSVHCLDPVDGSRRGRIQTGGGLVSVLLDEGDRILVAAEGGVFALTPTGDLLWAYDSRAYAPSPLAEVGLACTLGFTQQPDRK